MNHLIKRSNRYYLILKEKGYCSIDSLANRMGMPVKKVKADIKKMLVKGIFPQGAMDEQETCFIGNNEYYDQYQQALAEGRILFISLSADNVIRVGKENAHKANLYALSLAQEVVFGCVNPGSNTEKIYHQAIKNNISKITIF